MTTLIAPTVVEPTNHSLFVRAPFVEIHEPGCYVCHHSGDLYRIPPDALQIGRSPLIEIVSHSGMLMTKLSDDAFLPICKARQLAADADVEINF